MGVQSWAIRRAHRLIDAALGVRPGDVLNPAAHRGPGRGEVWPDLRPFLVGGAVDYAGLRDTEEFRRLCEAAAALHDRAPPAASQAARAWWINLYNTAVVHAVIAFGIRGSVWEHRGFFRQAAYRVEAWRVSADDIEHGILRGNRPHPLIRLRQFAAGDPRLSWSLPLDPRIHFALVCASRSCPPIRVYTPSEIEQQLDTAAHAFINGGGIRVDTTSNTIWLSQIFKWYQADFGGRGGVLTLVAHHLEDEEACAIVQRPHLRIRYLRYDWRLNGVAHAAGGA